MNRDPRTEIGCRDPFAIRRKVVVGIPGHAESEISAMAEAEVAAPVQDLPHEIHGEEPAFIRAGKPRFIPLQHTALRT